MTDFQRLIAEHLPGLKERLTAFCERCGARMPFDGTAYCGSCGQRPEPQVSKEGVCLLCGREFPHPGLRVVCGDKCNAKYLSMLDLSPKAAPPHHPCERCGKPAPGRTFCSLACGRGNHFGSEQSEDCTLCGCPAQRHEQFRVPLCLGCREACPPNFFWMTFFSAVKSASRVVPKVWGIEVHVANHPGYCLKYLIFYAGNYFSNHYHAIKKEAWHCLVGGFEVVLTLPGQEERYTELRQGDKLEVDVGVVHQIRALEDSVLVEVSTMSFPEDSLKDFPSLL